MKLLFAGAESEMVQRCLKKMGVKNILVSYWYIKKRNVDIDKLLEDFPLVVVDSGAFTMGASTGHKSALEVPRKEHEDYLMEYLDFLYKYGGKFYWAANYDLDNILGHQLILDWNLMFEELERQTGQRVCYVTHDWYASYKNMRRYFDRYNLIGLSGDHKTRKDNVGYFGQAYQLAKKHKKLCHGFAMTNFVSFRNFPMATVDSTTYLGGLKYGTTYVFNGSYFETWDYTQKYRRKALKNKCLELGIDHDAFVRDEPEAVTEWNIAAWLENEKLFNKLTYNRQWWLKKGK